MSIKSIVIRMIAASIVLTLMIGCAETERNGAGGEPAAGNDGGGAVVRDGADDTAVAPGGGTGNQSGTTAGPASGAAGTTPEVSAPTGDDERRTVLFLGTSLTAGLGLPVEESFPMLIQTQIDNAGLPFRTVNAGVSGETSAGALSRVDWLLRQSFDILVLETGANDMLRGIEPASTERNIQQIIDRVRAQRPDVAILLAGMLAMPNLGQEYGQRFEALYPRLAERNGLTLLPFLLEGVAAERELNQADGIHPNAAGHRLVAENVWTALEPVLREEAGGRTAFSR